MGADTNYQTNRLFPQLEAKARAARTGLRVDREPFVLLERRAERRAAALQPRN